jgi:hypothetical protein
LVTPRLAFVDATVVEANMHDPTGSTLPGDGVRVLTRAMPRLSTGGKSIDRLAASAE